MLIQEGSLEHRKEGSFKNSAAFLKWFLGVLPNDWLKKIGKEEDDGADQDAASEEEEEEPDEGDVGSEEDMRTEDEEVHAHKVKETERPFKN